MDRAASPQTIPILSAIFPKASRRIATFRRTQAGLPLPGNDQPLQSALYDLRRAPMRGLKPPAVHGGWELFTSIVDQIPNLNRAVLHGVGEPMLVKHLPRMVRYLKDRGTYVLFNTNGTVLNEKNGRALIAADLDELRVSFDAATPETYKAIRGKNYFNRILKNVRVFRELQEREGHLKPRVSAWLTGLRETVEELPDFVRVAAETGIKEVHLQRLVFFTDKSIGMARPDQALYEKLSGEESIHIDRATELAKTLGIVFSASGGASEPGISLEARPDKELAVVAVPPALDGHVFPRPTVARCLLHRAVFAARL